jgi:predicted ATPase/class 3 adenylate cyclase
MAERPSGTVTFLFSDIEGSTRLLRELGPTRYEQLLDAHRRLLRDAFERNDGYEMEAPGDGFFVAFDRPGNAVEAARQGQRALIAHDWPEGVDVRVRMGLHTGQAQTTPEGYVGVAVHRAARISAAGHGGQVLLSSATSALLEDEATAALLDLGEHRLKDLTEPQHLFQLLDPALPDRFPALRTLDNHATNLPVQPTALIGRDREVAEVMAQLRRPEVRLVTLTGPGGTGKTRLSLQAAAELLEEFPNGVYFVALAAITDPTLVIPAVAQVLGINEAAGQSLTAYLSTKRILIVLDNVEQVVAAAPLISELLAGAPGLKALATSREPLHLKAEWVLPVAPLGLPDLNDLPAASVVSQFDAVELFAARARALQPGFEVTGANAAAVAEICVRLDGLPLALELAAARIALLSPDAMLKRLGGRLKLLTSGARDLPARQQTLRGALAWSYDLLADPERRLFRRLGVFVGGFTIEASDAVADADLDMLGSLVDKSLVRREGDRFAMLETIREYALDQLEAAEETESLRARHAEFFEALAEAAYGERIEREAERSAELESEHDNLRAALEWLARVDPVRHLRLAGALGWFWHVHSHFVEARAQLGVALAAYPARDAVRARALAALGEVASWQGDIAAAKESIDESVAIWSELGRDQERALALYELGWGYFMTGDDPAASRVMAESLEIQRGIGDSFLINRAQVGLLQMLVSIGEVETVERLGTESLALAQRLNDKRSEHLLFHYLADCELIRGNPAAAMGRYRTSLEAAAGLGDRVETAIEIQGVAMATAGCGAPGPALRLAGAAQAELDSLGLDLSGVRFWSELLERYLGPARIELGPEAAQAASTAGRLLSLERATREALDSAAEA